MGRAILGVAAVFAQLTREMIAENVQDGLQRRAQAGLFTGNAKGYTYSREFGLERFEAEAAVVRQAFEWYVEHKWGSNKIDQMLNLRGIPSKTGVQWS
jgi:site-specific DNA recombinase